MLVKIGRYPGIIKEVGLEDGSTVQDALSAAELSMDNGTSIQVNGEAATLSTVLYEDDMVRLSKQIKGNVFWNGCIIDVVR